MSSAIWVDLGQVAEVFAGQSPESKHYNAKGEGLPFYQGKKDFGDRFIGSPTVWTKLATRIAEKNDILMSVRAPVGPVNVATEKCCIGRGLAAIRPKADKIRLDYLYYYLQGIQNQLEGSQGSVFNSINKTQISEIQVPLIPISEQDLVVSQVEEFKENADRLAEVLIQEEKAASELMSAMQQAVFASVPTASDKFLPQISKNLDSRRKPVTKNVRVAGSIPYYGASGIVDYVETSIFNERLLLVSEDGANLLARSTPIAFSIDGPSWVNNHAHVLSFENPVTQNYVEYFLNSINLSPWITGAAQPKLNQAALNSIPIRIPESIEDQRAIVEKLESVANEVTRLKEIVEDKTEVLNELFATFVASKLGVQN